MNAILFGLIFCIGGPIVAMIGCKIYENTPHQYQGMVMGVGMLIGGAITIGLAAALL